MKLRTLVRDALYLNWALPAGVLPPPPAPLRYQVAGDGDDGPWVFASVLLFRQEGARLSAFPLVRFSYPQMNLRLYVVDSDGVPAVYFREMLVPGWVLPAVRLVAEQPACSARFDYPQPSSDPVAEAWRWRVERPGSAALRGRLEVTARRAAPQAGAVPRLGTWEETVRFFRERRRGYTFAGEQLRRIETEHPAVPVWPMAAEVADASLLQAVVPVAGGWPALHSAWLCPEIPFAFELALVPGVDLDATLGRQPAATSTRSCT